MEPKDQQAVDEFYVAAKALREALEETSLLLRADLADRGIDVEAWIASLERIEARHGR